MTAETLKPFISSPSEHFSPANPAASRQRTGNLIAIGLSATCVTFTVVLLAFTIWNSARISHLQLEVKSVNRLVESMQKRLGLDYLDDLNDFEKEYSNGLIDDPNTTNDDEDGDDALLNPVLGTLDLDDYDDDNADDDDDDDLTDLTNENYDDDDEDDNEDVSEDDEEENGNNEKYVSTADPDGTDGDSYENDGDNLYDDFEKYKDAKKQRSTRSINSAPNGLPVYEESYALRRNKSGGPDDERIEQHLLHRSKMPILRPQQPSSTETSALISKDSRKRHVYRDHVVRRRPVYRSRVQLDRTKGRHRKVRPMLKNGKPQALTTLPITRVAAAHYHLNSSISGKHILHSAHSTLPHDGDMYIGASHAWAKSLGTDKHFQLNHGVLTVKESGLYYIYAQIHYDNRYDRNGFVVYHNVHPFLQCAAFVPTNINKSHTCHTSGLAFLERNDEIHIRDIHRDRVVSLTNAKSFFGLIKIDGLV